MSQPCGCCAANSASSPVTIDNRPGLSAIAYRVGTYGSFRQTMLDAIASTPELVNLTTRRDDDYSITFIDLWAALLDVLTFYQERNANEIFLGTARQQASLIRLARLLDYRPSPGVAALAQLAFTLAPGSQVDIPVGLRVQSVPAQNQQPQIFETLEAVTADARFNNLRIYPEPQGGNPLQTGSPGGILDRENGPAYLAALSANDPVVIFKDGLGNDPVEEKKIASLSVQDDQALLKWTTPIQGADWKQNSSVYKFRRKFRMFGFNAPQSFMQPTQSSDVPGGILWTQMQTDFTFQGGTVLSLDGRYADLAVGTQLLVAMPNASPTPCSGGGASISTFQLGPGFTFNAGNAAAARRVIENSFTTAVGPTLSLGPSTSVQVASLSGAWVTQKVTVTQIAQASVTTPYCSGGASTNSPPGAMSDTVTQITIDQALPESDVTKVLIFELVGDAISFWPESYATKILNSTVYLPGVFAETADGKMGIEVGRTIVRNQLVPGVVIQPSDIDIGRRVILNDVTGQPIEGRVQGVPIFYVPGGGDPSPREFGHLVIRIQVDSPSLDTASAVLLGNVVLASHGQTVRNEVLGSGAASKTFQEFTLQKQPLTYVPSSEAGGVTSSLEVSANQVKWTEVPEIYEQPATAQVYSTRANETGQTLVQGGDAVFGAVFPTGNANITATYRYGSGVAGNLAGGALTTLLDRIQGLSGVSNPLPAEGGADAESMDTIRQNAPRSVRTFDRAVSLLDFQDLITVSGEVAKALATWVWDGYARAVFLTVAGQEGGTFSDLTSLGATLANACDPNIRLLLGNYSRVPILLSAALWIDPAYDSTAVVGTANQAMVDALSFDSLDLAESIHLSQIYAILQKVPGVTGADVTRLGFKQPAGMTAGKFQAYLDSRGVTRLGDGTVVPVQDFLRIFPAHPDTANVGQVIPAEVAWVDTPSQDVLITAESS
jgi:uncharacterized phage protein gp47/JayE